MGFSIQTPAQVLFGRGTKDRAAAEIAGFGPRGVLVHGSNPARADWLTEGLLAKGCEVLTLPCGQEPSLPMLEKALSNARPFAPLWVAAIGGGSTWPRRWLR